MVSQTPSGEERHGDRGRSPKARHPWQHPKRRLSADVPPVDPRNCKLTIAVTHAEFQAFRTRARRAGKSNSELMRDHFPLWLLQPPENN